MTPASVIKYWLNTFRTIDQIGLWNPKQTIHT